MPVVWEGGVARRPPIPINSLFCGNEAAAKPGRFSRRFLTRPYAARGIGPFGLTRFAGVACAAS